MYTDLTDSDWNVIVSGEETLQAKCLALVNRALHIGLSHPNELTVVSLVSIIAASSSPPLRAEGFLVAAQQLKSALKKKNASSQPGPSHRRVKGSHRRCKSLKSNIRACTRKPLSSLGYRSSKWKTFACRCRRDENTGPWHPRQARGRRIKVASETCSPSWPPWHKLSWGSSHGACRGPNRLHSSRSCPCTRPAPFELP